MELKCRSKQLLIVSRPLIRPFPTRTVNVRMTLLLLREEFHSMRAIGFDVSPTNDVDYRATEGEDRSFDRSRAVVELISLHIQSLSSSVGYLDIDQHFSMTS